LTCLTAAVARQITFNEDKPDLAAALEGGLSAMRDLRRKGHGLASEPPAGFPAARLATVIKSEPPDHYSRATFHVSDEGVNEALAPPGGAQGEGADSPAWSILLESHRRGHQGPAHDLARLVALRGPVALQNLPHLRVGRYLTVDRREIESLRTLVQVVRRY